MRLLPSTNAQNRRERGAAPYCIWNSPNLLCLPLSALSSTSSYGLADRCTLLTSLFRASYGLTDRCTLRTSLFRASYGLTDRCTLLTSLFRASYGLADRYTLRTSLFRASYGLTDRCTLRASLFRASYGLADFLSDYLMSRKGKAAFVWLFGPT